MPFDIDTIEVNDEIHFCLFLCCSFHLSACLVRGLLEIRANQDGQDNRYDQVPLLDVILTAVFSLLVACKRFLITLCV